MIFRVVVMCEGFKNAAQTKLFREKVAVLVDIQSNQGADAFAPAEEWTEMNHRMGPKWVSFTAIEAAPVTFPKFVANL